MRMQSSSIQGSIKCLIASQISKAYKLTMATSTAPKTVPTSGAIRMLPLLMCMLLIWFDSTAIRASAQLRPPNTYGNTSPTNRRTPINYGYPAGLSANFYSNSCPQVYSVIQSQLAPIIRANPGQAAGILRIFFHDCFVQGCDASLLLLRPTTELTATPNNQSIRLSSVQLLDNIKLALEQVCPGVVSCADTIALSTAIAVALVGGPNIPMATGRRDSVAAASNQTVVNNIPPPTLSIAALKQNFQNHGLDSRDLVSLSGAHSIGLAHCRIVDLQLSPTVSSDLNPAFAANLSRICLPANSPAKQRQTVHLDFVTKDLFDNAYFQNILAKRALFHTDAQLLSAPDTLQLVQLYAQNQAQFFQQFSISMVKMSQLGVLTGNQGVIRRRCSFPN